MLRDHREAYLREACLPIPSALEAFPLADPVPAYLHTYYWWAYVHPQAVRLFERQWLANAILWGNYARLREAALDEFDGDLAGRTLQIACAYGDLTSRLASRLPVAGGTLDVVDVLPIQIENLRRKLPAAAPVRLLTMDSSRLDYDDGQFDRVLLFFLLHEQPEEVRTRTLAEAWRVVKPGGRIVIVDYARPQAWNPLRYLFRPVLAALEPFALDLWNSDIAAWLPTAARERLATAPHERYFGGLYQKLVLTR